MTILWQSWQNEIAFEKRLVIIVRVIVNFFSFVVVFVSYRGKVSFIFCFVFVVLRFYDKRWKKKYENQTDRKPDSNDLNFKLRNKTNVLQSVIHNINKIKYNII